MLQQLIIENLALLKHIDVKFAPGMTCLTGETGAGKSILLDALSLTMGSKFDASLISKSNNPNNNNTSITAIYNITANQDDHAYLWLKNNNFLTQKQVENNSYPIDLAIKINRTIIANHNTNPKSKNTINNQAASIKQIKQLGELLIYIHGQHEHLNLLKEQNQLKILDSYGRLNKLVQETNNIYKQYTDTKQLLNIKLQNQTELSAKKQLLEFQITELEAAELKDSDGYCEWEDVNNKHQWLANQEDYINQLNLINNIINNSNNLDSSFDDNNSNISLDKQLNQILNILSNINKNNENNYIKNITEYINSALIQVSEASAELDSFLSSLNTDPEELQKLDNRISQLHTLARKYKTTPENLYNLYINLSSELENLNNNDSNIDTLKNNLNKLQQEYFTLANSLSESRKSAAKKLSQELTSLVQQLQMPSFKLNIELKNKIDPNNNIIPQNNGLETCSFLVKTNKGLDFGAMADCASGGELSRVALATQVIKAKIEGAPSLIFDEVDVGIGGGTAEIVGKLLKTIGCNTQVMCITHLAQVAAQADQHLKVLKSEHKNQTITQIKLLNKQERIDEIARMIGGLKITNQTLAHASELLEEAQN